VFSVAILGDVATLGVFNATHFQEVAVDGVSPQGGVFNLFVEPF
jgi:hypothetical protein